MLNAKIVIVRSIRKLSIGRVGTYFKLVALGVSKITIYYTSKRYKYRRNFNVIRIGLFYLTTS